MKNFSFLLFSPILLLLSSCSKEGPEGPAGSDGVANIQSFTFHVSSSSWTYYAFNVFYCCSLYVYEITDEVVDDGTVEVFVGDGTGTYWGAIPKTTGATWINYYFRTGYVEVHVGNTNGTNPGNPGDQEFKVVVIPPSQRQANPDVNWNDYDDIARHFKIQEIQMTN